MRAHKASYEYEYEKASQLNLAGRWGMFQPGVDARVARNVTKRWHTFVESRTARPKNTVITITNEIRAQNVSHTIATDGPVEAEPHGSEKKM